MQYQTTLCHTVSCHGIGLHSGEPVMLALRPAQADHGIVFRRSDVKGKAALIPARHDLVADTRLGTRLTNKHGLSVSTVEHLMAALWGAGVDNALVEISGAEVPVMDGSSEPFSAMIEQAGTRKLPVLRKIIRVTAPVFVEDGECVASVEPYEGSAYGCSLDVTIDFSHKLITRQRALYDFSKYSFREALAGARTFGFADEVEYLRSQGLARGGSLQNAVVVGKDAIMNEGGLRFPDEFIRHKALDCIGDLYLAGHRIEGHFTFNRPGHGINNALLRALFSDRDAWKLVAADAKPAHEPACLVAYF